jgi:hypothetical protein
MQKTPTTWRKEPLAILPPDISKVSASHHITTHSCSCLCFGTPISSKVFGPAFAGLPEAGVAGFGVLAPDEGATLLLLSTPGNGLGLGLEGVAESTLGGGRPREGLLCEV